MSVKVTSSTAWMENEPLFGMTLGGDNTSNEEAEVSDVNVVLGGGTPLGSCLAENLAQSGRRVRSVVTNPQVERHSEYDELELVSGNPLDPRVVEKTCSDAGTIYICLEFPHGKWKTLANDVLNNTVCFAIAQSKKVVLAYPVYDGGRFRNDFDDQTIAAHKDGFIQVLVARLPQLYGPGVRNILFDSIHDAAFSEGNKVNWVGDPDAARDLLYVDDAARACAALGTSPLAYGRKWEISSGTPITGRQFIDYAFSLAGKVPETGIWRKNMLKVAGILDYDSKEMSELPYDYSRSMVLDGSDFIQHFPGFEFTPIEEGLRDTFEWYRRFLKPHTRLQEYLPLSSLPA